MKRKAKLFRLWLIGLFVFIGCITRASAQELSWPKDLSAYQPAVPRFRADTFDIRRYGAKADGRTLNTQAIQSAIDACSVAGGGVVLIPDGFWLTGPIVLKSGVDLHLQSGALLQFTRDRDQYPLVKTSYEGLVAVRCQSPISAENAENIAITGAGIVDGGGDAWRMVKKSKLPPDAWKQLVASGGVLSADGNTWYPSEKSLLGSQTPDAGVWKTGMQLSDFERIRDFLRPNLLKFTSCKKILLQGVTFRNSPAWCLHPLMCEDLTVSGITVYNPEYAQNGDGIDVESCTRVLIENSQFATGDDGICLKSGRDEEGRKRGMPTQFVQVRNCVVYHAHGGFVIGSEMSGGVHDVVVQHCTFIGADNGLRFKTTRGRGGVVENIFVDGVVMENIVHDAILFDMYYMATNAAEPIGEVKPMPVTEATPVFRRFLIRNVVCRGAQRGIYIRGLPEMPVQQLKLEHIALADTRQGLICSYARQLKFEDLQLFPLQTDPVIDLAQVRDIQFDILHYAPDARLLLRLQGAESGNIRFNHLFPAPSDRMIRYTGGASRAMVEVAGK
ncbi:glycoside hydrolase family 28 protein [Thermoflavifilum aggregans]|uniref:glycoside hydrolase family 28 protein n=1 Tax=Thermoflavifilum aggregans TaxID=454188 RepID=UPI0014730DE9|nr:glycoside hydrolase family 28 protein [Thermoflavifilum aggregans]